MHYEEIYPENYILPNCEFDIRDPIQLCRKIILLIMILQYRYTHATVASVFFLKLWYFLNSMLLCLILLTKKYYYTQNPTFNPTPDLDICAVLKNELLLRREY